MSQVIEHQEAIDTVATIEQLTLENNELRAQLEANKSSQNIQSHSVTIGGKINIGNFSAIDLHITIGLEASPEYLESGLQGAIAIARASLGQTLVECLKSPPKPNEIAFINEVIPPNMEGIIKNNSLAVWLLTGAMDSTETENELSLDDMPF